MISPDNKESTLKGKSILVAEDNLLNQIIARKTIEKWEVSYEIAENGQKAIDFVLQKHFDVILMDLQMPVLDGFDASRQIRAIENGKYKNLPIIALTASVSDELENQINAVGMNGIVLKPYTAEKLFDAIVNCLK